MTDAWIAALSATPLAFAAGALLGAFYFGGLWWTVARGLRSAHPAPLFVASLLVRSAVVVAGFLWVSGGAWPRLVACAAGFLGARLAVTRLTRGAEVSRAP
ncbi:MAG: ATP synthase subunit I [Myxococcales bacterium]|nr:ATP synthase subunit I [Myxococcales bacterium]MCB9536177.1 ATP synthase subunit I [Myxococcales bacterium]